MHSDGALDEIRLVAPRAALRVAADGTIALALDGIDMTIPIEGADGVERIPDASPRMASPLEIESTIRGERRRVVLSPERAAAALCWDGPEPVRATLLTGAVVESREIDTGRVVLQRDRGTLHVAAMPGTVLAPGPSEGSIVAEAESSGGVIFVAMDSRPERGDAALLRDPELLERTAAAWLGRRTAQCARWSGEPDAIFDLWDWTTKQALLAPASCSPGETATLVSAMLAAGAFDLVRHRTEEVLRDATALEGDARSTALLLTMLGRTLGWTGDATLAVRYWPAVDAAMRGLQDTALPPALIATALREAARLADAAGARGRAAILGADALRVERVGDTITDATPALADPREPAEERALASALLAAFRDDPSVENARATVATLARRLPLCGDSIAAALTVDAVATGALGIEADAGRGRITLAPRLAALPDAFEIGELTVADAAFRMAVDRTPVGCRIEIEQTAGSFPFNLILSPRVPLAGPCACTVDGIDADLNAERRVDDWIVPVQLSLDAPRILEVRLKDG